MINKKKILGFVPARMGSKGIKNKNLKILNKKPLIYWPINALKKSKFVDTVLLSTDSTKIRKIGLKLGAEAPFLRPKKLATDNAMTTDAIKHALKFFSKKIKGSHEGIKKISAKSLDKNFYLPKFTTLENSKRLKINPPSSKEVLERFFIENNYA